MKVLIVDGIPVSDVSDAAEAVITKLQGQLRDATSAQATLDTTIATHLATIATRDGEIVALNAKVADAVVTPERLDQMVADRAVVVDAAKAIIGDTFDPKGLTDAAIRKAAVVHKLGDDAKDMDDNAISGAFKVLAKDGGTKTDNVREVLIDGVPASLGDARARADAARAKMIGDMNPTEAAA